MMEGVKLSKLVGKTIQSIEHLTTNDESDSLKVVCTNGIILIVYAQWCNDHTAGLDYKIEGKR